MREYLEGLRATKPKRGRKRTPETIAKRLEAITSELASASPIDELLLIQERKNLEAELAAMSNSIDMKALERDFVSVAKSYGDSKAISYSSWRDVGVPASVLKAADIGTAPTDLLRHRWRPDWPSGDRGGGASVEDRKHRRVRHRPRRNPPPAMFGNPALPPMPASRCAARSDRHRRELSPLWTSASSTGWLNTSP